MASSFYSHGKLLLSGEYAVLDGALALALPTRFGQHLNVKTSPGNDLSWIARDQQGQTWFETRFTREELQQGNWDKWEGKRSMLGWVFQKLLTEKPERWPGGKSLAFETRLEFPSIWGLGSSSTLINCLADWSGTDAYRLNDLTFGSSGYDIACARAEGPIFFSRTNGKEMVERARFQPDFADHLYFVHLGKKQDSREGIRRYRNLGSGSGELIAELSRISRALAGSHTLPTFCELLEEHEDLVASALELPRVREQLFPDFKGTVKSLGAWGGDFVLAAGPGDVTDYFQRKGYPTILSYPELIL